MSEKILTPRETRFSDFEAFIQDADEIFRGLSEQDPDHSRLSELYSFYVSPGGRQGGVDERRLEVHYGARPVDRETSIDENLHVHRELIVEGGASLLYERSPGGHVLCMAYPARTRNLYTPEEAILLERSVAPRALRRKARRHWSFLFSYMQVTSLDGEPTAKQRFNIWLARKFKKNVKRGVLEQSIFWQNMKRMGQLVLIGLSGFLIFIMSSVMSSVKDQRIAEETAQQIRIASQHLNDIRDLMIRVESQLSGVGKTVEDTTIASRSSRHLRELALTSHDNSELLRDVSIILKGVDSTLVHIGESLQRRTLVEQTDSGARAQ